MEIKKETKWTRRAKRKRKAQENLHNTRKKQIEEKKLVGVDPGKHTIVHMTNETSPRDETHLERKTLSYTAAQRRFESNSLKRSRLLQKHKTERIQELENSLSETNSRSPSLRPFEEYLIVRFHVQEEMYAHYTNNIFRIYRWQTWKDRRRSEDKFINRIGETFGNDCVLAYGTWSTWHGMKGLPSSPTTGLRRRIAQRYWVVDTCEYRTTKTCSRCQKEVTADSTRKFTKKDGEIVPLRSIRRCNNVNQTCEGFLRWNRDHNAAINIRANLLHWIQHGKWDPSFAPNC